MTCSKVNTFKQSVRNSNWTIAWDAKKVALLLSINMNVYINCVQCGIAFTQLQNISFQFSTAQSIKKKHISDCDSCKSPIVTTVLGSRLPIQIRDIQCR